MGGIFEEEFIDNLTKTLGGLDEDKLARALALFSNHLTVLARGTYEIGTEGVEEPGQLRDSNEIQHQVTNQLVNILMKRGRSYSERGFIDMLIHRSQFIDDRMSIIQGLPEAIEEAEKL